MKQLFEIKNMDHMELVDLMNERIKEKTGIDFNFNFELSCYGNLDLYAQDSDLTKEQLEKLVELNWIDESEMEDYHPGNGLFEFNPNLELPNKLFDFILEETFVPGTYAVGVFDLGDHVSLNIAIPHNN